MGAALLLDDSLRLSEESLTTFKKCLDEAILGCVMASRNYDLIHMAGR